MRRESEETEVKDVEWLNNEVDKRINKIKTDEVSFVGSDYFDEGYIHGMRDVQSIANQMDEPEVLSQEWIDENEQMVVLVDKGHDDFGNVYSAGTMVKGVTSRKLQNLLVPKQEKVKIPRFVAQWIEFKKKSEISYDNIFQAINELYKSKTSRAHNWVLKADENKDTFARAWLDGYTVEEEPRYIIDLDDEEISDGIHYLKSLEMSVDGVSVIAGDPLSAMAFESEEAQLIAEYIGGRVKELEE